MKTKRMQDQNDPLQANKSLNQRPRQKLQLKIKTLQFQLLEEKQKNDFLKTNLAKSIQDNQNKLSQVRLRRDTIQNELNRLPDYFKEIESQTSCIVQSSKKQQSQLRQLQEINEQLQSQKNEIQRLKSQRMITLESIKKKIRNNDQQVRKAKQEINRLNIELGIDLSISNSKSKFANSFLKKNQDHKRLETNINNLKKRISSSQEKHQQLNTLNKKLFDQIQLRTKQTNQIRKKNEQLESHNLKSDQVEHKMQIEQQLLVNFRKQNRLLRQKLQNITGEKYFTESLPVYDISAGSTYRAASQEQLQRLVDQKMGIICRQEDQLERVAEQIDKIASEIRKLDSLKTNL